MAHFHAPPPPNVRQSLRSAANSSLRGGPARPIAFVWIKPPGESDGDYPTTGHTHAAGPERVPGAGGRIRLGHAGAAETVLNQAYNNVIAPAGNTQFGFRAGYSGTNAVPTLTCVAS